MKNEEARFTKQEPNILIYFSHIFRRRKIFSSIKIIEASIINYYQNREN